MYLQYCVKGIAGAPPEQDGMTKEQAVNLMIENVGLMSNWWLTRPKRLISPPDVAEILTYANLDRHLHDYAQFGRETPFISFACGSVERDALVQCNWVRSAVDVALMFATENWTRPGVLFYAWVATSHRPAVAVQTVAEPVRDLNIYQGWSPYQPEGEVTAKVHVPANQIEKMEWWTPLNGRGKAENPVENPHYVKPELLSDVRPLF